MADDVEAESQETLEILLNHVFFPRVLPEQKTQHIYDEKIMIKMVENVEHLSEWLPQKTVEMLQRLKRVHLECTKSTISEEINDLEPGDTFAMFIRRQNCAIMIHVPANGLININDEPENVIVATFPGSLHPRDIKEHLNDIEFNYPVQAIKVKFSPMLRCEDFANQMCLLHGELPVETKVRDYVSKWLMTVLMDDKSTTASTTEYPVITKKIRDIRMGENKTDFFCRSNVYMSIKVMIQHNLVMQMGIEMGKFLYKIVMLRYLVQLCTVYIDPKYDSENIDLLSQMNAKMARRIEKLAHIKPKDITKGINHLYEGVVQQTKEIISTVRVKIDAKIELIHQNDDRNAQLDPLTGLNFDADICYKLPTLREYLIERMEKGPEQERNYRRRVKSYRRYCNQRRPAVGIIASIDDEDDRAMYFTDFENMILYDMGIKDEHYTADELRQWLFQYLEFATEKYLSDPLMASRMNLVCLKLIAVLDRRATIEYPLFKEHRSGINSNIINSLLLPQRIDMETAHRLEKYFRLRNLSASDPSLIEEANISRNSFSVKYAQMDAEMYELRNEIMRQDEKCIQLKRTKWIEGREHVKRLRDEANQMECHFYTKYNGEIHHHFKCKRCDLLKKAHNVHLEEYEHLLPKAETEQFAVVFELRIPNIIACLRDILYGFSKLCVGSASKLNIKGNWIECGALSRLNNSNSRYVSLGSTKRRRLNTPHVDENFKSFIVENSFNCVFHAHHESIPTSLSNDAIKNMCAFKTYDEYTGLQWTLKSNKHTENEVLCRQSECPQNLSLAEYKKFGTLRADGHRLQFRKLYALIETEGLSFEKESVLSLILQTLWECGVNGDSKLNIQEPHMDFIDPIFCIAMIELLDKFIEQQKENWVHPFKLLMATLIVIRAFEINGTETVAAKIVTLLNTIRLIVLDWIEKIETIIHDERLPNESSERELRLKLCYVAITGAVTFFIHKKHKFYELILGLNDVDNRHTAAKSWLHFIIVLRNNINLYENTDSQLPTTLQIFLQLIVIVGLNLEQKMKEFIIKDFHDVFNLIKMHWSGGNRGSLTKLEFSEEYPHVLVIETIIGPHNQTAEIDIVTGKFLVNGSPLSRLPLEMTQHESFRRVFGNRTFEVQLNAQNRFCTIQKNNELSYEFENYKNNLIVTERRAKGHDKELIPYFKIKEDLPHLLVFNYCHWWNKHDNCIEFRQRIIGQTHHLSKDAQVDYLLDLITTQLIHVKTKRPMLYFRTPTYRKIVNQLRRLEHPKYIDVLLDTPQLATVELQQMKLKFRLDCTNNETSDVDGFYLESNEFSGMRVSRCQKIGTLYGLNNGLVLESCDNHSNSSKTKILLIPHGKLSFIKESHISVDIDTKYGIENPPFYQYQVDEFCHQLKASNSNHASWFYLAYLHAITSHGEIEPLLGMSGTERALQILQSTFAWSSSPYEPEAIQMLKEIAKLSPIRKSTHFNQSVIWPEEIPKRSAQDSFLFIVKKLLEDSQRLYRLHSNGSPQEFTYETELTLNEREYRRCLPFQPNFHVMNSFIESKVSETSLPEQKPFSFSAGTQFVSILYHKKSYKVPTNPNLYEFLTKNDILKGTACEKSIQNILFHTEYEQFSDLWISLYDAARNETLNVEQLTLIFSLFAHQRCQLGPIYALQSIAMNPDTFKSIDPPSVDIFHIANGIFDEEKVINILRSFCNNETESMQNGDDSAISAILVELTSSIAADWPCDFVDLSEKWTFGRVDFELNLFGANDAINQQLIIWNNNRKLFEFIDNVESKLKSLPALNNGIHLPEYRAFGVSEAKSWKKYDINMDEIIHSHLDTINDKITLAKQMYQMEESDQSSLVRWSAADWWTIIESILYSNQTKHLIQAGLLPRVVPSLLLPKLIDMETDDRLKALIGAWAMAIAHEQREKRIAIFSQRSELKHELDQEIENKPHVNWKPYKQPEWLIFEIEQNLTIRRIQIDIAKRMISPPARDGVDVKHSVMQLNMGEGKTAVIVPILASVLADGTQACQITVLKSLFARNLKSLRQYLGGMLNRRVYVFPCRRDMPISQYIEQILGIYEECKMEKGVILTLPEYRLSMQLKIYEPIQKQDFEIAKQFLNVHKWINANVRNILDESDAILQANYQLIYTVGNQLPPDGGSQRWFVTQAVLKRIPHHMKQLYRKYGEDKIEFDMKYIEKGYVYGASKVNYRSDVFTPCRILDEAIFDELKEAIVADFFNGQLDVSFSETTELAKENLKNVISEKVIDKKAFHLIESYPLNDQNTIMILSGLLRFEVLKLALTKRWRVNYGVDPKGQRKMAIPFKAKDIASEMTEFGHPDVAICFTQMSYYYSGLTDAQLYQLFDVLQSKQNATAIYAKWIDNIPKKLVNGSIRFYTGINLDNSNQRDNLLFPLLRYNMHVIDFWLSNIVFPYEAKVFEQKLMCTAWDLCSDQLQHRVTGFSGTNDTKNVLPLPVTQNDLEQLENTNESMRQVLLLPVNQSYENLPTNVSGMQILERLTERRIPVLLDSGALMLELTNEQVAIEWLKMTSETIFDAAVYFDARDVLQTIDRNGNVTEFDCTVYRENLNRCIVYLDDVHTRGTDLKFPLNWKACVTLSGDITRDKTVQSCMRMRQLGKNHSICFWASYEADIRIRKMYNLTANDEVKNEHVIEFICSNSCQFEKLNMVHWTAAALNYTKKTIGHKLFEDSIDETAMDNLFAICVDNEFVTLNETYGDKEEALLTDIAWTKFDRLNADFKVNREIRNFVRNMQDNVFEKLKSQAVDVKQFSHALDEEQEKELEQELEEQRFVERPPAVKPATPDINNIKPIDKLILDGVAGNMIEILKSQRVLFSFAASLSHTQLFRPYKKNKNAWANHLYVSRDFNVVVDSSSQACDEFLRPVEWIARITNPNGNDLLVLLSSFECNLLLPSFRKSTKSTLFMYRPRLNKCHSTLLHEDALYVTDMDEIKEIDVEDEVQIGMYAGTMYFESDIEQNAYCGFMGLIPRPRSRELEIAFEKGAIRSKGFVPMENRQHSQAISECVGQCKFYDNPVDLAIKIIEAHHQTLLKESHVASILEHSTKMPIENGLYE